MLALLAGADHVQLDGQQGWPGGFPDHDGGAGVVLGGQGDGALRTRPPDARIRPQQAQVPGFCGGTGSAA